MYRWKKSKKKKKSGLKKIIKAVLLFGFYGLIIILAAGIAVFAYFAKDLPDPEKISQRQIVQSTKIYDRTGQTILYDIHGEEKRTIIPLEEIPQDVKDATIAIEDVNFYHHIGIDLKGILRAVLTNLKGKAISQGGSTITQQFIKNAVLSPERTFTRKIKEAILSLEMERKYSKDQILTFYLNQVPYGSNAYGIEAAAQTFFNKKAKDLTLAESTLLAALPQATTYYSPYGSHTDELKQRQEIILDRMVNYGYASKEKAEAAKKDELKFSPEKYGIKAPHFVMYVREYLEKQYGADYIEQAGLKVYTTLDYELQQAAEKIVSEQAEKNKKYKANNAALAAIDPKTGQILTMVGSRDYFDIENQGNYNVATSPNRQPGSSFKPFVYAAAFKRGFTPETILFDLQTNFGPAGDEQAYIPRNYDGKFRGPVTMKQALANSLNIPAVKTLYLAGINESINLAQDMGITTLKERNRYYLSLVLGGGEIKLLDEIAAYGVFAAEGVKHPQAFILKIEDTQGKILEEYKDKPVQVLDPQITRQISDILSDNNARAPIFGLNSKLNIGERPAAAKTGTTQSNRDGWTVGYTPSLAAGAWVGNNDNSPMILSADGGSVAAPIWNAFIKEAYKLKSGKKNPAAGEFILPQNIELFTNPDPLPENLKPILKGQMAYDKKIKIDKISGKLATELTPPELIEERSYLQIHSILYYVDKQNPRGEFPKDPSQDQQFINWENPVLDWAKNPPCAAIPCSVYNQPLPTEYDDTHSSANLPEITITTPNQNEIINQSTLTIKANAQAFYGIKQLDFFINNQLAATDITYPYSITINISPFINKNATSTDSGLYKQSIKVKAYDKYLNRQEDEIYIFIGITI